ncbi:MAG: 23S rRNA (uracil(1939)-C(5))-methyltransferase RlmD [Patescibacteria group bacterium]|nr:23S rRNA (uracil(1939)-C(5))-methyltransferase RlmD [Patescibacteria group bacterium]
MRFGHRVTGTIQDYDDKGRGYFELTGTDGSQQGSGRAVIPFSAKGDELDATFLSRDRGNKICKVEKINQPGSDRIVPPCPHAGVCGGCLWQHLRYDAQLSIKRDMINRALESFGHAERIDEVMACQSPSEFKSFFRNRMDYAVGWNSQIGLKEYGSWSRYVDVKTCYLLNPHAAEVLQHVREWMVESDLQPWDAKYFTGDVRYVVMREGKNTKQLLVVIVVKDATRVTDIHRSSLIARLSPYCTSLLIGEQNLTTDISLAQKFEVLVGNPWLEEIANDVTYRIHPNSFFQTNTRMAEELQKCVFESLKPNVISTGAERSSSWNILDLYCGLGFFGIYLAKNNTDLKIHGFEIDEPAIELAKFNAAKNGVAERCEFFAGKAEDLSWKDIPADTVILDPPRSGLHPKVLKTLLDMKPRNIIYVSCNYHRLVDEMKQLKTAYHIEDMKAFDLFPHTPHVEVVTKLSLLSNT